MGIISNQDKWCAIVNSFAASSKATSLWSSAEDRLRSDGINFHAFFTGEAGNATTLAFAACAQGYRKFIAVGGDGTIHDVLDGIMSFVDKEFSVYLQDFTLAVIPVGSGNDWIKTTGVPKDIIKAASLLKYGRISRQDVVRASILDKASLPEEKPVSVSYMANVGGVGLDARVCVKVNRAKREGKKGKILYVLALLDCILHRDPASAYVICDGRKAYEGGFLSISFGIGKYSGGGMRQTPDAVVDDGLLDMTLIPDLPLLKIAKEAPKLFNGKLLNVPEVVTSRARTIEVIPIEGAVEGGEPVEVDGEVVGNSPVRFEILENQLNIIVPHRSTL